MFMFYVFQEVQYVQYVDIDGVVVSVFVVVVCVFVDYFGEQFDVVLFEEVVWVFIELVQVVMNLDFGSDDEDECVDKVDDEGVGVDIWLIIVQCVMEDYVYNCGGFVWLMYGGIGVGIWWLLQLVFNCEYVFLCVLIVQLMVGCEGLNLYLVCWIVVLLYLEWNLVVVEQQIGCVDWLGSLWECKFVDVICDNVVFDQLLWIEIWFVVFEGIYDEIYWVVLIWCWDNLWVQLYGDILLLCVVGDEEGIVLCRCIVEVVLQFLLLKVVW